MAARLLSHDKAAARREAFHQGYESGMAFPLGAHRFAGADRLFEHRPRVRSAPVPGCQTGSRGNK
ncbi:hypothetical protein ACIBL8_38970 [Streptomyces sp. NPDC050523]|uniref:hypothetical protein n=1 Tax=Streptomyces sp. NPDC050523 TaxID=3365622 RepID=UPI0037A2B29C